MVLAQGNEFRTTYGKFNFFLKTQQNCGSTGESMHTDHHCRCKSTPIKKFLFHVNILIALEQARVITVVIFTDRFLTDTSS